jgi:signal peptidase I
MRRTGDPGHGPDDDAWDSPGADAAPHYDPLLKPWDEVAAPERAPSASYWEDPLFAFPQVTAQDDAPPWQLPPRSVSYPDRFSEPYADRLTEWQRRLREGTITIPKPERRWTVTVRELAETVLLAVLIFLAVRASFQNFRVEGASMVPSLEDGEYLVVNKLSYAKIDMSIFDWLPYYDSGENPVHHLWGAPARGDVVVFRSPTSTGRDFIKRIIGVPGDVVEVTPDSRVIVNGHELDEPYVRGGTNCNSNVCTWFIPERGSPESYAECGSAACYFVMGDNRQNSSDSRQGWLVPEENIVGKALITYWHQGGPELKLAPNHSIGFVGGASAEE